MKVSRPCYGCLTRNGCEIRDRVVQAIRGLPVSSVRMKCDLPFTRDFPPGSRVQIMVWDHSQHDEPAPHYADATVISPSSRKPGKVLAYLDEAVSFNDDTKHRFVTGWPKDLRKLAEPMRSLCDYCRLPLVDDCCTSSDCREMEICA